MIIVGANLRVRPVLFDQIIPKRNFYDYCRGEPTCSPYVFALRVRPVLFDQIIH